ncbi:MAG TPA: hypothetical protein VFQ91_09210 [Bryobacteraceae bacterium]|nr:hypothetical protein [Bryobacteraceae bacterium]
MRLLFLVFLALPAFTQPVVLVNGYQLPPCDTVTAESTFGQLPQRLRDLGREVIFFNNCSVAPAVGATRPSLEALGTALGQRIAQINAPQVDVVVHSMGGLILRAYLSGKQSAAGSFAPPAIHKVRKAVFLGTPHFGPGLAQVLLNIGGSDPQVRQIVPGTQFIADLATWNQGVDDLRGIDAVAVAGNVTSGGDGLVPVPSASLSFAADAERTRVVPYCHTDVGALALVAAACSRPPYLANVNSDDHLSWRIIRSFFSGTDEWRSLGTAVSVDATGSTRGGLLVVPKDKDDNVLAGVTVVAAGSTQLQKVADYYYAEQIATGSQNVTVTAAGGNLNSPQSVTGGLYSVAVVKTGPYAAAVLPAAGRVATRTLAPGMFISLYGATLATDSAAAQALPLPVTLAGAQVMAGANPLGLQFAGPTQINALLPEDASGLITLTVKAPGGMHKINILVEAAVPAIFTQTGTGSGTASALNAITGVVVTTQAKVRAGDVVSLFLTGLGATETKDGLQWAKLTPKVFAGGLEAKVTYAGRAPGYAGLDQINFVVPDGVASGDTTPLRVESNGRVSNSVVLPTL